MTPGIKGNKAIEDAAVEFVIAFERHAGRDPRDTRNTGAAADIESSGRVIEVKAAAGSIRNAGFVYLEPRQVEEARANPNFFIYLVENIGPGFTSEFQLRILGGERLRRLVDRVKERRYFELPVPVSEHDALLVEETRNRST
ncbi:MAG: DUF3883 domain-containing protein [Chloroflexota bacterium]|nr:DUF3883 domain-containing protein [Chloroflexota bacterium]